MNKVKEENKSDWLDKYGLLVYKHKTNKRLFLQRTYYWVDRIHLIDETEGRQIIDEYKWSTYDTSAWELMTYDEYKQVKNKYIEIYE